MTTIRKAQATVEQFMAAGGQTVRQQPTPPDTVSADELAGRFKWMQEEHDEFVAACTSGDLVEAADAIADGMVILLGHAAMLGLDAEKLVDEVLRSNNTKINWVTGEPWVRHPDGKIGKDHHFEAPNLTPIIESMRK